MHTTNKTILITGGGSGIGFAFAKALSENNKVIITGRSEDRLKKAAAQLKDVSWFAVDVNNGAQVDALVEFVEGEFGGLDILVNNAGTAFVHQLDAGEGAYEKAAQEMDTNYLSVIRLTDKFLPQLRKSAEAAIVNVSSIVAFVPRVRLATYAASKAALHAYTQALRHTLAQTTGIKVFEVMPPLVDTEFSAEIGGANGIPPSQVADHLLYGLAHDQYELHTGDTEKVYQLFHSNPEGAFGVLNS